MASGSGTLYYQWKTNGVTLPGATSSTLSLSSITVGQAGNYTVVITNTYGSITSSTAVLTVLVPPSISMQPSSQTVTAGASVNFSVVASGTSPLGYRWQKGGSFISGANSSTYSLPGTVTGDSGNYTVVVTNSAGSITSSVATLTVNAAPVAPSISTQPTSQSGPVGGNITLSVVATGTGPLSYQWRHDGIDVSGGISSALNLTGLTTNDAGDYQVVVTNSVGSITSSLVTVTVTLAAVAPGIAAQPQSLSVIEGTDASFGVTATGTAPLRYQWLKGGVALSGATNSSLLFTPALASDEGDYAVAITNIAGAVTSSVATLTVQIPDNTVPTLVVLSPSAMLTSVTSNTINLFGTAADNQGVTAVLIRQNGGEDGPATGTTSWSATASLVPGTNTFEIKSTDAAGNFSITNRRVVVYTVSLPLSLTINGGGTVSGATNGQLFEVGKALTLKFKATPGNVFSNCLVNGESNSVTTLALTMSSNLNVVVNFVPNPFVTLKGNYSGLFYPNSPEPPHEQSGYFTVSFTDGGKYSCKLYLGGFKYSASGALDLSLRGTKTILRKGTNEIVLALELDAATNTISGFVSNLFWNSELFGYRATFSAKSSPATNYAGKYTMLFSGGYDAAISPAGQSPATLDVKTAGSFALKGTLSDGAPVAQKGFVAANGQTPFYVNLYKGSGSLFGWVTLMDTDTNDTPGLLLWTKKETSGGKTYLAGFTNESLILGSRYVAPAKGVSALGWSDGVASLDQGNLSATVTSDISLSSANKFSVPLPNTDKFALTLSPTSGLLGGSFMHPNTAKKSALKGVILQKQQIGGGYFLGTDQSGKVSLGE